MAGIGKTTLAKRIFYSPCVSNHFHPRAWVKISQVYCRRDLLLQLLLCVIESTLVDSVEKDDAELEAMLYRSLKGRRYLVVMDDLWSIKPDDKTGSRAIFALSYEHLPHHLKPRFLYMGAFPRGFEVAVRMLIKLWIAEGFIDPIGSKSLEDVAEDYLNDITVEVFQLVGRSAQQKESKPVTCMIFC
ncbi:hypothetical protein Leryth_016580 [Lithospermum erythrorhizon]|nr:hypothetical protein Leryth_016580 [Lithospermum erythrorhizon]